jgi:drug/metabolite transporter (DMT)-like permease
MLQLLSSCGTVRAVGILLAVAGVCAAALCWAASPSDPEVRAQGAGIGAGAVVLGLAVWALSAARERRLRRRAAA